MIEKYIKSLLKDNKRVIIPDFGGFVVKRTASGDAISFNGFLKFNDDLLITAIAEGEKATKEEAMKEVLKEVETIRLKLDEGVPYEMSGLGFLVRDKKGNVRFMNELALDIEPPVESQPKTTSKQENDVDKVTESKPKEAEKEIPTKTKLQNRSKINTVQSSERTKDREPEVEKKVEKKQYSIFSNRLFILGGILLVIIAIVLWLILKPVQVDTLKEGRNDMVEQMANDKLNNRDASEGWFARLFKKKSKDETEVLPVENETTAAELAPVMAPLSQDTVRGVMVLADKQIAAQGNERYNVIVGSFQDAKNARALQKSLVNDGYGAQIFDRYNGWQAVSLGGFPSLDIALRVSGENVRKYPDLWILVK